MDPCKGTAEKKGMLSHQQSFRIDDLLTRRAIEQQPDHFGTISSPDQDSITRDRSPHPEQVCIDTKLLSASVPTYITLVSHNSLLV